MDLLRPYCTLDAVRRNLENAAADEDLLKEAVNRASRKIEDATGRNFWFNDYTETAYRVKRADIIGPLILLPFEVITLTEVLTDGEALEEGSEGDYVFEAGDRLLRSVADWTGNIDLTGTFGYALAELEPDTSPPPLLPEAVSTAAIVIASVYSGLWRKSIRGVDGTPETIVQNTIPPQILKSLERFNVRAVRASM